MFLGSILSYLPVLAGSTAFFLIRSSIAATIGFWFIRKNRKGNDRRIYKIEYPEGQLKQELLTDLKVIPFYSLLVSGAYFLNLIHFSESSFIGNVGTFAVIFIWNEIWFYGLHRLLHTKKFMFIHKTHHRARVASPFSIACFSLLEQSSHVFFALILPIAISSWFPITFVGLGFYSFFQITVNLLGHMNIEIYPPWFANSSIGKWVTTPTFHILHHGRSKGHYGLLTTIPDRIFGTYFHDYTAVQRDAALGKGLTRLSEKRI